MVKNWYVVRVQSGKEELIKENLQKKVKAEGKEDLVSRIVIPTESVSEIKAGKKRITQRKTFPGYLMVEMEESEEAWFLVRESPGIGDFIGAHGKPTPMAKEEVDKVFADMEEQKEKPRVKIRFKKGDGIKIKEGLFENFEGVVDEVFPEKGLVKVIVTIFGRATEVELEYWQVEPV